MTVRHYIAVQERKDVPKATRFKATIRRIYDHGTHRIDIATDRCTVFAPTHAHAELVAARIARINGIELGEDPLAS
jgi:hypothetical protein